MNSADLFKNLDVSARQMDILQQIWEKRGDVVLGLMMVESPKKKVMEELETDDDLERNLPSVPRGEFDFKKDVLVT